MKTNLVYEVTDLRTTNIPMRGPMRVASAPGGIQVQGMDGLVQLLEYDDEYPEAFLDDEAAGVIEVRTTGGRVILEVLTLPLWEDDLEPFIDTPDFKTDAEVQDWFMAKLGEAAI